MTKAIFGKDGLIPGEPTWKNWEKLPPEKFVSRVGDMLNFYNTNVSKTDLKRDVLEWMKYNGYTKTEISKVKSSFETEVPFTAAKIARALNVGMPESHPEISTHYSNTVKFLKNHIAMCKTASETSVKSEAPEDGAAPDTKASPKVSPAERLRDKVETTALHDLSFLMDQWIEASDNTVQPLDIVKVVKEHDIPLKGHKYIREWLNRWLKEVKAARDKTDPELVEAYSYLNKRALNAWCKHILAMLDALDKYETKQKTVQKNARKSKSTQKKQTAAQLQKKVAKVQYQENVEVSETLFLNSIAPIEILGSRVLYTYNTKYRRLSCFMAANHDGLTISGTTVKNFDPDTSYVLTVRKPEDLLKLFTNMSVKHTEIEKAVSQLKSKRSVPTGRINQNVVLLANYKTV